MSTRDTFEKQPNIEGQYSNNTGNIKKHISEKSTQTDFYCNERNSDSQIFNIHIHLPAYKVSELISLPKIQPEVHIHFDGLVKKLNTNKRNQNEVSTNDEMRNLSPSKFGDVQFHNKKKFKQSSKNGCDITIRVPRASINDSIDDIHQNVDGITETVQRDNINKVVKCSETNISNITPYSNINNIKSNHQEPLNQTCHQNVCLKEPIVLVKDICKSKAYKALSTGSAKNLDKLKSYKNESCDCEQSEKNQNAVDLKNQNFYFKVENESFNNELFSPNSPNCSEKSYFSNASGETSHFQTEYINSRSKKQGKSLAELAEGCNFSEILSRFKLKKSKESFEDFIKSCDSTVKTESKSLTSKNSEEPNKKREEQILEEEKNNTPASTLKILVQDTTETLDSESLPSAGLSSVCSSHTDNDNYVDSKLLPKLIESNTVSTSYSSVLKIPKSNSNNNLSDFHCSDVELELIRKEMQNRVSSSSKKSENSSKSNKKELDSEPAHSPAPKKIKLSNEGSGNSHKSTKTPSMEEDYVPLQASGPTKFAVASLNNLKPYKTHDAKNFKSEMLFGNRVNRFSEPAQLRIYNLNKSQKDTMRPNYS